MKVLVFTGLLALSSVAYAQVRYDSESTDTPISNLLYSGLFAPLNWRRY